MKKKIFSKIVEMIFCKHEYESLHYITIATRKNGYYVVDIQRCSKCDFIKVNVRQAVRTNE